ncbi:hypothetical protein TWF730_008915 [Orbilia blumenaviensis]|uniref:BTB domain-containing protein n=1 Tax=Orbilia blumenaviensis TaxID=1796055 RepID=A0AAV9UY33_9PEZI
MAPKKGKRLPRVLNNPESAACEYLPSQPIASGSETGTTWEEIPSRTPSQSEGSVDTTTINVLDIERHELQQDDFKPPVAIPANSPISDQYPAIDNATIKLSESNCCKIIAYSHLVDDSREFIFFVSEDIISMSSSLLKGAMTRPGGPNLYIEKIDMAAFYTILRILHFDIQEHFLDIGFKNFVPIVVLCERFKLHRALRPWIHIWLEKYKNRALDPGFEDWLYISTALEPQPKLEVLVNLLSNECSSIGECGTYVLRRGREVPINNWPVVILRRILLLRDEKVKSLTHLLKILTMFFKNPSDYEEYCKIELCLNIAYGSLFRSIEKEGLYRLLEPGAEWHGSVEGLREKLNKIKIDSLNEVDCAHACSIQLIKENFMARVTMGEVDTIGGIGDTNDTESKERGILDTLGKVPAPKKKEGCTCTHCQQASLYHSPTP